MTCHTCRTNYRGPQTVYPIVVPELGNGETMNKPRLLDCRKVGSRMSSLSYSPRDGGLRGTVAAHEGTKPLEGDYLALRGDDGRPALYRVVDVNWCMNVDPANMWIAHVEFVPGRVAKTLTDLPEDYEVTR